MKLRVTPAAAALAMVGCAAPSATVQCPPAAPPPATANEALGTFGGQPITRADIDASILQRLNDLENESEQRKLHLLWVGFEDAVSTKLLAAEAKRRGISVEKLRQQEIQAKAAEPSEEEVRAFYDDNADAIDVPFEAAAPHIKSELLNERQAEQERAFVEALREKADIRYTLPTPALPRIPMDLGDGPSLGPANAKATLLVFSDFQCPYCARARHVLERLRALYPDDLRIVYRYFPLSQHKQARLAAVAAECAYEQDKFWPYHDLLFDNANALEQADLERYGTELGLDVENLKSCMQSDTARRRVDEAEAAGRRMGVEGTPAIYINGMKLVGLLPLPLMQALIDRELGR